jgi:DNA helicase-2/ATP-dependent DNA helicase PcrA
LTASHYKAGNKKPREVSLFLRELLESNLAQLLSEIPEVSETNPLDDVEVTKIWPFDPLGQKRSVLAESGLAVTSSQPADLTSLKELTLLLEERERTAWQSAPRLPLRLSASRLMQLLVDPSAFAAEVARPMPQLFDVNAERGTVFHTAIEDSYAAGEGDSTDVGAEADGNLVENFENSRFAEMTPVFVEKSIEFELGGLVVVCKLDAVFETLGGFEIVDWKSGSSPKSQEQLEQRGIQLSLYRIALAKYLNLGVERVSAKFFFAGDGVETAPKRLWSEVEIIEAIEALRTARQG